jgi:hypothetical protein
MHGLDVIIVKNAEQAGRELGAAFQALDGRLARHIEAADDAEQARLRKLGREIEDAAARAFQAGVTKEGN